MRASNLLNRTFEFQANSSLSASQIELDSIIHSVNHQAGDWKSLAAFTLGAGAFRWTRLTLLENISWAGVRGFSSIAALGVESAVYGQSHRLFSNLSGESVEVESWRSFLARSLDFGVLRVTGHLFPTRNPFLGNQVRANALVFTQIFEEKAGLVSQTSTSYWQRILQASVSDVSFQMGQSLFMTLNGGRLQMAERVQESITEARVSYRNKNFQLSSSPFSLSMNAAEANSIRSALYAEVERLGEQGLLPEGAVGSRMGPFVDFMLDIFERVPVEHQRQAVAGLRSQISVLWTEFLGPQAAQVSAATKPTASRRSSEQEWLLKLLDFRTLRSLLEARSRKPLEQRIDEGVHAGRLRFRAAIDRSMGAQNMGVSTTVCFRHAAFLRWMVEQSPLAVRLRDRRDLQISGAGIGGIVMPLVYRARSSDSWFRSLRDLGYAENSPVPFEVILRLVQERKIPLEAVQSGRLFQHQIVLTESVEMLATLARDGGEVHYLDINSQVVKAAEEFRRTGKLLTVKQSGAGSFIDKISGAQASVWGLGAVGASQRSHIEWAIKEFFAAASAIREFPANEIAMVETSEFAFPAAERLHAKHADLLFATMPSADLALAFVVLEYVESREGPLRALATLRLANAAKPEGLVALSEDPFAYRILRALNFRPFEAIRGNLDSGSTHVYQRPAQNAFHDEVSAKVEELIRGLH